MDKTLTLRVDDDLHHKIKIHIAKKNIKLKDYIINLIKYDLYTSSLKVAGKSRKENTMDDMTNSEMVLILRMVLQIIKDSENKEDIIKKIEELLKK